MLLSKDSSGSRGCGGSAAAAGSEQEGKEKNKLREEHVAPLHAEQN